MSAQYLPVTAQQFEDLTNGILVQLNALSEPHKFEANYVAQVVMSAVHALPHTQGLVAPNEIFDSVLNRISCHLTYNIVQDIQAKLKMEQSAAPAQSEAAPEGLKLVPDEDQA